MKAPTLAVGSQRPCAPAIKATAADGRPLAPPDNSAEIYAAVTQTSAGIFISIWSLKASVWVRLLNRYSSRSAALSAIETYGWTYWDMAVPPHSRELRGR